MKITVEDDGKVTTYTIDIAGARDLALNTAKLIGLATSAFLRGAVKKETHTKGEAKED